MVRHKSKVILGTIIAFVFVHLYLKSGDQAINIDTVESVNDNKSSPVQDPLEIENIDPQVPDKTGGEEVYNEPPKSAPKKSILKSIRDYRIFFNELEQYKPTSPSIKNKYKNGKAAEKFSGDDNTFFSKDYLENVLDIPEETYNELKESHQKYVDIQINKLMENYGVSTFGNILISDPEWNTYKNSRGYVLIGGGKYSWLSYLVIKQIRATGSTMPIELFIATGDEYEKDFCEKLLPKYNARCNLFDKRLIQDLKTKFNIGGFQYKMLALLTSKFENVIYLDSDNFPVKNPEYILDSELYKETGLIIWPDAWARTTNPKFYEIAGVNVKENKIRYSNYDKKHSDTGEVKPLSDYDFTNSWFHDFEGTLPDPTSEAGMLIVNKTKHVRTLLLCLYYNVFGPNHYYPLMTQGSAGEGDKETFIAAAHVLNEPWYQTRKQFKWTGYFKETDGSFDSKALGHYDPVKSRDDPDADIDLVFMHLSYPKYYPNWLADNHDLVYAELGNHIRMYKDMYSNAGYDFDLRVLQFFTQGLCPNYYHSNGEPIDGTKGITRSQEYMAKYLYYVDEKDEKDIKRCLDIFIPHLQWLKDTTEYPDLVVQPVADY